MIETIIGFIVSSIVIILVIYAVLEKKFQTFDKITESSAKLEGTVTTIQNLSKTLFDQIDSVRTLEEDLKLRFQKFYDTLIMKPSTRGTVGEGIIKLLLNCFPEDLWQEQYDIPDGGRVDFAIFMPPDRRIVPLDSKFSFSENIIPNIELAEGDILLFDKDQRKKVNELVIKRIPEVAKYIKPSSGTMNFALMFIPDSVYLALRDETLKKLQSSRIIPVNTSGLLSTLFLIERQYTSIKISKVVDQLEDIKSTVETNFSSIKKKLETAEKHSRNSNKNIKEAINSIEKAENEILARFGLLED